MRKLEEDKTIDYIIRATWYAIAKMYNEQAAYHNSTMVTGYTLLSIDPKEGTPSTALGPKMGVEPTSISRTLKALEDRNLIARKSNPNDGRGVIVHLTKEGLKMRDISKKTVKQFNKTIRENVDKEKLQHFNEVMEAINNLITDNKIYN